MSEETRWMKIGFGGNVFTLKIYSKGQRHFVHQSLMSPVNILGSVNILDLVKHQSPAIFFFLFSFSFGYSIL